MKLGLSGYTERFISDRLRFLVAMQVCGTQSPVNRLYGSTKKTTNAKLGFIASHCFVILTSKWVNQKQQ